MLNTNSIEFKVGVAIGALKEKLERKQRFDLIIEDAGVEYARELCKQHKFSLFSVHYEGTRSRVYGAPSYLPPEPEPQPPGTPVIMRQRQSA